MSSSKREPTKVGVEDSGGFKIIESKTLFVHTIVSLIVIFCGVSTAFAYLQKDTESVKVDNKKQDLAIQQLNGSVYDVRRDMHKIETETSTKFAVAFEKLEAFNSNLEDIKELLQKMYEDNYRSERSRP